MFSTRLAMPLKKARFPNANFFSSQPLFLQKDVAESEEARKVTRSLETVERMSRTDRHDVEQRCWTSMYVSDLISDSGIQPLVTVGEPWPVASKALL